MAVEMLADSAVGLAAAAAVANERIVVPGHFDVEVYGTFRRLFRQRKLTRARFDAIVVRLARLAAERVGLSGLLLEAHVIADRVSATVGRARSSFRISITYRLIDTPLLSARRRKRSRSVTGTPRIWTSVFLVVTERS